MRKEYEKCIQAALEEKQKYFDEQVLTYQKNTENLADDYATQLISFRESFLDLQNQSNTIVTQNKSLKDEIESVNCRIAAAVDRERNMTLEMNKINMEYSKLEISVSKYRSEINNLNTDLSTSRAELQKQVDELDSKSNIIIELEKQSLSLSEKLYASNEQHQTLEDMRKELEVERNELRGTVTALSTSLKDCNAHIASLDSEIEASHENTMRLDCKISSLDSELTAKNEECNALTQKLGEITIEKDIMEESLTSCSDRIKVLSTEVSDLMQCRDENMSTLIKNQEAIDARDSEILNQNITIDCLKKEKAALAQEVLDCKNNYNAEKSQWKECEKNMIAELKTKETDFAACESELHQKTEELKVSYSSNIDLVKKIDSLNSELETQIARNKELYIELDTANDKHAQLSDKYDEMVKQSVDSKAVADRLLNELSAAQQENHVLAQDHITLQQVNEELEKSLKSTQEDLNMESDVLDSIRSEYESYKKSSKDTISSLKQQLIKDMNGLQSRNDNVVSALREEHALKVNALEELHRDTNAKYNDTLIALNSISSRYDELQEQHDHLNESNIVLMSQLDELRRQLGDKEQHLVKLADALETKNQENAKMSTALSLAESNTLNAQSKFEQEVSSLQLEKDDLSEKLELLNKTHAETTKSLEASTQQLEMTQEFLEKSTEAHTALVKKNEKENSRKQKKVEMLVKELEKLSSTSSEKIASLEERLVDTEKAHDMETKKLITSWELKTSDREHQNQILLDEVNASKETLRLSLKESENQIQILQDALKNTNEDWATKQNSMATKLADAELSVQHLNAQLMAEQNKKETEIVRLTALHTQDIRKVEKTLLSNHQKEMEELKARMTAECDVKINPLLMEMSRMQEAFKKHQAAVAQDAASSKADVEKLKTQLRTSLEKIKEVQSERDEFKKEFDRVSTEYAIAAGHTNTKQRIHYVESLKQQLNKLVEENSALRARLK